MSLAVTTLFPLFGFQAANRSGSDDPEMTPPNIIELSPYLRQAGEEIGEADLHAYVDCVLEAGHRARVEAQLARCPEDGMIAAAYRRLNIDLHRLLDRDLPPLTASLEALSREFERRLNALSSPEARQRRADGVGDAIRRAPAVTAVVVISLIAIAGLTWPLVAGEPASCSTRVEALEKSAAKGRFAPELGERLAAAGRLCSAEDPARVERELTRLEYETRRIRH